MAENKEKMPTLLDWVKNIESELSLMDEAIVDKGFSPFIVGRVLSRNQETLNVAVQADQMHDMPKYLIYKYMHASIPKKSRYGKWGSLKGEKPDEIELFVMRKYQVNLDVARQYIEVHSKDQLKAIKTNIKHNKSNSKR